MKYLEHLLRNKQTTLITLVLCFFTVAPPIHQIFSMGYVEPIDFLFTFVLVLYLIAQYVDMKKKQK